MKERILQFIDYKGFSKRKFYAETGLSNGILDKTSGLSVETLEKIYSVFPEINLEWLITGKGSMLKEEKNIQQANNNIASTITQNQNSSSENSEIEALRRENTELKNKLIKLMEEKLGL